MPADLFEPFQLGDLTLANRIVMAPMTRNRAEEDGVVTPMMVTYYQQRASAGLIITESAPVSPEGVGYPFTPGIYTGAQAASWRRVTDAVHSAGGRIFIQLQHCGRISHPSLRPDNATPVGPSALRPDGQAVTYTGMQDFVIPRALETDEIPRIVAQFQHGAEMAKRAGFDGVEVHGANGYIIDQFLRDASNHRSDGYGGSVQNRMRLLNGILDAVCAVWPVQRVGVRLSPENGFNSMSDSDPQAHFGYVIEQLSPRGLAYVHVLEGDMMAKSSALDYGALRVKLAGPYIANSGYDLERAQTAVRSGAADLVAFGIPFVANPDLVRRYREGLTLAEADPNTFYGGGEAGYTDYPFYRREETHAR
ncbi:MAG: alkene reductase [Gammaproteobacteria bacterium]|nr:alkene reductase [Gammaproteobacteria bacterium]NIR99029.1 alkene reductase [Gammaproteobacteria bacterium]NIT64655.1 alkene reductase [Gammaproteobacteria bacterium]NIV21628.1 alkene reductase [Gammaproteobacteria bacterium]NIY33235.1 alkene reductase [Gammaproteobacteria bacterium]